MKANHNKEADSSTKAKDVKDRLLKANRNEESYRRKVTEDDAADNSRGWIANVHKMTVYEAMSNATPTRHGTYMIRSEGTGVWG